MSEDINAKVASDPTTPEPKAEPKAEPKEDAAALLKTLKELGVDSPEKIQGMAQASQQTGKAFNEVGQLRKQLDETNAILQQMQQRNTQDPYADGETVDLAKLMDQRLEKFWNKQTEQQNAAQERYYREMGEIKSNPRFAPVKDMWEAHLNSPETAMKLRSGETTLKNEFNNLVFTFQDQLLQRAYSAMSSSTPQTAKAPHIESGETQSVQIPTTDDERTTKLNRAVKARADGTLSSNDSLQQIVNQFLPADDPIFKT